MQHTDPVLETLFLPVENGEIALGERALFIRARDGLPLRRLKSSTLICEQTFKPDADALVRAGLTVDNADQKAPFDSAIVPRRRSPAL